MEVISGCVFLSGRFMMIINLQCYSESVRAYANLSNNEIRVHSSVVFGLHCFILRIDYFFFFSLHLHGGAEMGDATPKGTHTQKQQTVNYCY